MTLGVAKGEPRFPRDRIVKAVPSYAFMLPFSPPCIVKHIMRTALGLGHQCLRQGARQCAPFAVRVSTRRFTSAPPSSFLRRYFANPRFPRKALLWSGAGGVIVSPFTFIEIGNDGANIGEQTHEEAMLEVSRRELKQQVPSAIKNSKKYRRTIYFFVDMYIIEPICTGLRFLHLVVIFVPVIATIPAIWVGRRQQDKDNERSGTLWWYAFLVRSMERSGAAFIKVSTYCVRRCLLLTASKAGTMGCIQVRHIPYGTVQNNVNAPLSCSRPLA